MEELHLGEARRRRGIQNGVSVSLPLGSVVSTVQSDSVIHLDNRILVVMVNRVC